MAPIKKLKGGIGASIMVVAWPIIRHNLFLMFYGFCAHTTDRLAPPPLPQTEDIWSGIPHI